MAIGPDYSVRPYADKYARDETPVSESDLRSIQKMADNVDSKKWGIDTRYSISSSMRLMDEVIKDTLGRQDEVEGQFQDVIDNTTGKDVISAPEIIAARNGEANLKARLDKEQQEVTTQLAQTDAQLIDVKNVKSNVAEVYTKQQIDNILNDIAIGQYQIFETPSNNSVNIDKLERTMKYSLATPVKPVTLEVGVISNVTGEDGDSVNTRLRTRYITVDEGDTLKLDRTNYRYTVYEYNNDLSSKDVWEYQGTHFFEQDTIIRIVVRGYDSNEVISGNILEVTRMIKLYSSHFIQSLNEVKPLGFNNFTNNYIETGKNKFNKYDLDVGYLEFDGRLNEDNDNYRTNREFIRVLKDQKIVVQNSRKIIVYDNDYKPIDFIDVIDNSTQNIIISQNGWLRVSTQVSRLNSTQVEIGEKATNVEPYIRKLKYSIVSESDNSLIEKSLLNIGDSIATPSTFNNQMSYPEIISDKYSMSLYSYSVGGATIGDNGETRSYIYNQLEAFISENENVHPDYILVNGMTNDILYSILGERSQSFEPPFDIETFGGGLENLLYKIKSDFPESKILYVLPHQMNTRDSVEQTKYYNLLVEILNKWSVDYVDMFYRGGLNTKIVSMRSFTDSGTHPTKEGYEKFYVPRIEAKLKTL